MNFGQPFGIAVLVVGAILLAFGYHFSEAPVDQISNTLTGRYTDNTMWYIVGGTVLLAVGGVMTFFGKRA